MNKLEKHILDCSAALEKSGKTFEEIYSIIFSHGDNVFARYTENGCVRCYTYSKAEADIELVAKGIASKGIRNRYVALFGENCKEWIVLFWGILASGNKPYLVNLKQPVEFTKRIMDTLVIDTVVCVDSCESFDVETYTFLELKTLGSREGDGYETSFCDEFAISSSGTTLCEKICIYSGKEISAQLQSTKSVLGKSRDIVGTYKGEIRQLAFLPFYHIFGLVAVYLWYALWGSTFVFLESVKPKEILTAVKTHQVTHIFAVPFLWNSLEKSVFAELALESESAQKRFAKVYKASLWLLSRCYPLGRAVSKILFRDLRKKLFGNSVRFCISGGSFVRQSALELMNVLGYTLCNGYGMTEIGVASVELTKDFSVRIKAGVGQPFQSVEYKISNDSRLFVKGDSVCRKIIVNGRRIEDSEWFDTGDLASRGDDGYFICGRVSDLVVSDNGENLNPDFAQAAFALSCAKAFSVLGDEKREHLMLVVQVDKDISHTEKLKIFEEIKTSNSRLPDLYKVRLLSYTYDDIVCVGETKVSRDRLRRDIANGMVVLHRFP